MDRKETIARLARMHAGDWKSATKTDAEIINAIIRALMKEGCTREHALDVAEDALRYIKRYF
jgi:hypothetical protein